MYKLFIVLFHEFWQMHRLLQLPQQLRYRIITILQNYFLLPHCSQINTHPLALATTDLFCTLKFLLSQWKWKESESGSHSVVSNSLRPHGRYSPWNSPGQNTGVGSLSLLWGIFPTQGSNPGLLHCGQILYQLNRKGSPRILEWVAYPFSSKFSQPRNQTRVSYIAGGFFTNWAMREALHI